MKKIGTRLILMDSGERFCVVLNKTTGVPLHYPNIYLINEYRNCGKSISTIELVGASISMLYNFLSDMGIDLVDRILSQSFLSINEIDALRDFTTINTKRINIIKRSKSRHYNMSVRPATKYFRLTSMANYLEWLCQILLMDLDVNQERISVFIKQIEKRRPVVKKRNAFSVEDKGLNEDQIDLLLKTIQINSEINPFITDVQVRNRLMILILYTLGIRCGELLNLQITDIDFHDGSISIRRRADEKSDPRRRQPLVKTLERKIELSDVLLKEIRNYMLNERRKFKKARRHSYLFVTHKSGPTQGQPISKSGYNNIISEIKKTSLELSDFAGHQLRHTWNNNFSKDMDASGDVGEIEQEKIRSYNMGWSEKSKTSSIYNERFIREKAGLVALSLQNDQLKKGGLR